MNITPSPAAVPRLKSAALQAVMKGIAAVLKERFAVSDHRIDAIEQRIRELEQRPRGIEYQGVWEASRTYQAGDAVTVVGSLWICRSVNTGMRPGESSHAWQLAVKKGRDGRDYGAK
jgi:hypothetical protein